MLNGSQDHRVLGAGDIVADQQFLVELLRRTQAGIGDLDIPLRMLLVAYRQPHEIDHAPRQIPDPDRLAHVEDEHIAALRHGTRLNHELRGLRDGHEIADYLGMRHGYRPAGFDLLTEQRNDRARRRQYIAESHHAKPRLAAAPMQTLQDDFGESLGRTHDIGGIHGLVGRYQNEGVHVGFMRRFGGVPRRNHIVVDALDDVLFDDGDMFVGGRVIHGLYPVRLQDVAQSKFMVSVADQADQLDGQGMLSRESLQLTLDVVERQFRHFEQDQPLRAQADDLPAELGADGAAGPGDHDHTIANAGVEQTRLRWHRIASQQVAYVDLSNVRDRRTSGHQLFEFRDSLHMDAQWLQPAQDLPAPAPSQSRQCQQNTVDIAIFDQCRELLGRVNLDAVDHAALQALLVVDEDQRIEGAGGQQSAGKARARVACPVDGHPGDGRLDIVGEQVVAHHEARARDVQQREAGIDGHDAPGKRRYRQPVA